MIREFSWNVGIMIDCSTDYISSELWSLNYTAEYFSKVTAVDKETIVAINLELLQRPVSIKTVTIATNDHSDGWESRLNFIFMTLLLHTQVLSSQATQKEFNDALQN